MELQLQAGSTVVATTNFATSMFNADWQTVNLKGPGAELVKCQVKLRGIEFFNRPSAPPATDPEATVSEHQQPVVLQLSLTAVSSEKTLLLLLLQKELQACHVICPEVSAGSSPSCPAVRPAGSPVAAQALQGYPTTNPHRLGTLPEGSNEEEQPPPPPTPPPRESYLRAGIDVGGLFMTETAL